MKTLRRVLAIFGVGCLMTFIGCDEDTEAPEDGEQEFFVEYDYCYDCDIFPPNGGGVLFCSNRI